jgi:hypothetical protein
VSLRSYLVTQALKDIVLDEVGKELSRAAVTNNPKYQLALTVLQNFAADPVLLSNAALDMLRHAHFSAIEGTHVPSLDSGALGALQGSSEAVSLHHESLIECHRIAIVTAYIWRALEAPARALETLAAESSKAPRPGDDDKLSEDSEPLAEELCLPPSALEPNWALGKRAAQVNLMNLYQDRKIVILPDEDSLTYDFKAWRMLITVCRIGGTVFEQEPLALNAELPPAPSNLKVRLFRRIWLGDTTERLV